MNYFRLFGLPIQFRTDRQILRKKFFELSAKYHPDRFAASPTEEQERMMETSAMLNKAYKTLTSEDETIRYILQEKGLIITDEKYALSPDFLMEMMELNDELPEALEDENKKVSLTNTLKNTEAELYSHVQSIIENYKEGITPGSDLLKVKDYYFKKKYLLRIAQQLGQKL
jgi:molecular chaperone HscB